MKIIVFILALATIAPAAEKAPVYPPVPLESVSGKPLGKLINWPKSVKANEIVEFDVEIVGDSYHSVKFLAEMPEHNHGLLQLPKVEKVGVDKYRVSLVKFHMPGKWELSFDFEGDNGVKVARSRVMLNVTN